MDHDIMVHGIPNLDDAAVRLREELDEFENLFGEVRWVRMGQNRRFHRTNYAFVRYMDTTVHQQVVRHFNERGIPHTNIWFEINPRPTEAHHVLQAVPATPRVAIQLAEVERIRAELENQRQQEQQQQQQPLQEQLQLLQNQLAQSRLELNRDRTRLVHLEADYIIQTNELAESRQLVQELLSREPQPPERRARWTDQWVIDARERTEATPLEQLAQPPTTKCHKFEGGICPICRESFEECLSIVTTQCGHLACEQCMYHQVHTADRQVRDRCPTCRSKLASNYYTRIIYN